MPVKSSNQVYLDVRSEKEKNNIGQTLLGMMSVFISPEKGLNPRKARMTDCEHNPMKWILSAISVGKSFAICILITFYIWNQRILKLYSGISPMAIQAANTKSCCMKKQKYSLLWETLGQISTVKLTEHKLKCVKNIKQLIKSMSTLSHCSSS